MEIRDPVHGTLILSDSETLVVDSPEYQRLRLIRQLGFSEFAYPAATHNRYLHSLGVCHLAGLAFDQIFNKENRISSQQKQVLRRCLKLAALLHDVGHGPLSHVIEEVMPDFSGLHLPILPPENRRATHEDYTLKYLTNSPLTEVLRSGFPDFTPLHVACLIDHHLKAPDDFFMASGVDYRPILSQLVSSELDCDRMDYLERDSYFCGTNYGKIDLHWMLANLGTHLLENRAVLALNRRALYTFDDFLISRHHMHLMVYFHHKSIIYEEMLHRYLTSSDCGFFLPSDINEYTSYTDSKLYE
ncbi:MAG: HD domain-containing protein, partial [Bdellovibrio sp.]